MARWLSVTGLLLATVLIAGAFFELFPLFGAEDRAATDALFLLQLRWAGVKYVPDALAYAYYSELNDTFPVQQYKQPQEKWDVPDWFVYPPGGTTVECNGLGCTVWNLEGGSSQTDPCPTVKGPVEPEPSQASISVSPQRLRNRLEGALSTAIQLLLNSGDPPLRSIEPNLSLAYKSVSVVPLPEGYRGSAVLEVNGSSFMSGISTALSKSIDVTSDLNTVLRRTYTTAVCECVNDGSGQSVVVAEYNVVEYWVDVNAASHELNETLVSGSFLYLRYFVDRISNTTDGNTYSSCRMVIR